MGLKEEYSLLLPSSGFLAGQLQTVIDHSFDIRSIMSSGETIAGNNSHIPLE